MEKALIHPINVAIIKEGYKSILGREPRESLMDLVDDMGYIDTKTMRSLAGSTDMADWDFESHFGEEKFRPTILRGRVSRALNEEFQKEQ